MSENKKVANFVKSTLDVVEQVNDKEAVLGEAAESKEPDWDNIRLNIPYSGGSRTERIALAKKQWLAANTVKEGSPTENS